jgi:hypothetical protein
MLSCIGARAINSHTPGWFTSRAEKLLFFALAAKVALLVTSEGSLRGLATIRAHPQFLSRLSYTQIIRRLKNRFNFVRMRLLPQTNPNNDAAYAISALLNRKAIFSTQLRATIREFSRRQIEMQIRASADALRQP